MSSGARSGFVSGWLFIYEFESGSSGQRVMFKHAAQFFLDPVSRETEFLEGILVFAFEVTLPLGGGLQPGAEGIAQGPAKVRIELLQRRLRILRQVAIIDAIILLRIHLPAE